MAEYVDKAEVIETIKKNKWASVETKEKEKQNLFADEIAFNIHKDVPTADVVERSKIDKAIEEIEGEYLTCSLDLLDGLHRALEILKRNIGE